MTDALSLLLQRAKEGNERAREGSRGKENEGIVEWHGHRSYFTARLYCILNVLFHTRRHGRGSSDRGVLYELRLYTLCM